METTCKFIIGLINLRGVFTRTKLRDNKPLFYILGPPSEISALDDADDEVPGKTIYKITCI